ncbi:MAG TPA: hypothetical protein VF613_00320 [Longimicrobium sp.]
MPVTIYLQGLAALIIVGFGGAALAAVRHEGGFPQRYRRTWRTTGLALLLIGVSASLQNVHGALAIFHGEGSRAWNGYMRWAPAWNHGREAVLFALALLLLASALAPRRLRVDRGWTPALALLGACAVGSLLGWLEGSLDFAPHFRRVAVLDAIGLLLLAFAVAACMMADVVDRLLIVALVAYAVPLPLNALWFAWMASHVNGGWSPSAASMQVYRIAFDLMGAAVAVQRWRLARRGAYVSGLLPAPVAVRPLIG